MLAKVLLKAIVAICCFCQDLFFLGEEEKRAVPSSEEQ